VRIGIAYQFMPTSDKWRWLDGFSAIVGFRDVTAIGMRFQTLGALEAALPSADRITAAKVRPVAAIALAHAVPPALALLSF
jgi:hypothetical protein